jgi:putative transposase
MQFHYLHYNPVKHKYVDSMYHWPWSSLNEYMEIRGKEWIERIWKEYPLGDYGKGRDW